MILDILGQLLIFFQLFTQLGCTAALPDNDVMFGAAGGFFPKINVSPLFVDASFRHFRRRNAAFGQDLNHDAVLGGINLHRIMLHISWLGIKLGKFFLRDLHDILLPVENNGPGAGGALVQ